MLQRLVIAQALMEEPEMLLLDEPFNSIDQEGVKDLRNLIKEYAKKYITILLSSHNQDDIGFLCDEIIHLKEGKLES
jgi:ABC-2 type transport system ATP-binding protein